ncbi:MAG: FtsW/RodA/SpoVE family cell cycle protein [Minisyncoccia bacterium]
MIEENRLLIITLILLNFMIISLTALFSLGKFDLFLKQILFWLIGFLLFFSFKFIDYKIIFEKIYFYLILAFSFFLLILVLFTPGYIKSWFNLGPFSFQPSEFAKLSFFLLLSNFLSYYLSKLKNVIYLFFSFSLLLPYIFLIYLQPDMGMVFLYFLIWFFSILFFLPKKTLAIILISFFIIFLFLYFFVFKEYQRERIISFIFSGKDPLKTEYNLRQIRIVLGVTNFFGLGVGNSEIGKYGYLPSASTDFILTFIIEERGYFGFLIYLFLIFLLIREIYKTYFFSKDINIKNFTYLVIIYFLVKFLLTTLINFGMFPIIGLPLSFLSYGGSHLIFDLWLLGILNSFEEKRK